MKKSMKSLMEAIRKLPEEFVSDDTSMAFTDEGSIVFNHPYFVPIMYRNGEWFNLEEKSSDTQQVEEVVSVAPSIGGICRTGHRFMFDFELNKLKCIICGVTKDGK